LVHTNFTRARNLGIYNRRNIAGTQTPSLHSEGRALDIGLNIHNQTEKAIGDGLFQIFVDLAARLQLQEVIWNRQIWSTGSPAVHPYAGANPHTDHVHVGFTRPGSQVTQFPALLHLRIAQLRTGMEEVSDALRNMA